MAISDSIKNFLKPTKAFLVDAPIKTGALAKDLAYDGPKWIRKTAFSKKGALIVAGIIGAFAAAKGIANWSDKNKIEGSQVMEANDLRASIEANKMARVETSMAMGDSGALPYRSDWRSREKGGLPGQQLPS